ncbi:MAG: ABC transporter ATP-binding protein [Chitinophagaceae bacterium]|nr:ABC transporter ATP-binding protein [Chitinophagaceae bacterium]
MQLYPLLKINDLSVHFNTERGIVPALKNISFEVKKGEIVAIVGESGSGKSVTSLSILQLLPVPPAVYQSGGILFSPEGKEPVDLLKLAPEQMMPVRGNKIAMIFQEPMTSLNPVFTCGEQVMEAILLHERVIHSMAKARTLELFNRVMLPEPESIFRRYPHQLSGGQKQRVMIAMAMSCNPSLLIADEPTTALDVTVQKTILRLIKQLQVQSGMGVIFITHDLGVVKEIADRVIVMYRGEIVEQGSIRQVYEQPAHPYTKALLACRPALHPKGSRLPVVSDFMGHIRQPVATVSLPIQHALLNEPEVLMEVEHLKVWFPAKKALFGKDRAFIKAVDDVSFKVLKGETLGLVGESGCGKSTLGRALLRLIEPTAGKIIFRGRNLTSISESELRAMRKDMQLIFQDPYSSLNPSLPIGAAIMEPLKVHGLYGNDGNRKEKTIDLLIKVNLQADHFKRYPHEFSGGQRQRVVIARALALNPSFIICDESVSALDVSVQAQVLNLLNDLKKEFQFTAIFISHDLSIVRYISDRIMVMNKGRIVETGTAEQVYFHPVSDYTRQLIDAIPG